MSIKPVDQFPGKVAPATPDNPFGTARNITIPGDGTGTPWESSILKDEWGFQHAMLINAGMEPNGTPDSAENSQLFKAAKASIGNGANLLSNHNFLIASPDDSQPPPDSTPRSYPPGFQIFSGVFANETTGILNLTYIDGRVSFSGGDFYMSVPNTGALEKITEFVASVADFDGKPRTRGVSYSLVGDEYRVTVGVDALEDAGAVLTPLGSVKFEQGSVATGHEVIESIGDLGGKFSYQATSIEGMILGNTIDGNPVQLKIGQVWEVTGKFRVKSVPVSSINDFEPMGDIYINDFGLIGDGTGNNKAAMDSATEYFRYLYSRTRNGGNALKIKGGYYRFEDSFNISLFSTSLIGEACGVFSKPILFADGFTGPVMTVIDEIDNNPANVSGFYSENIEYRGADRSTTAKVIQFSNDSGVGVDIDAKFFNCTFSTGIDLIECWGRGLTVESCEFVQFDESCTSYNWPSSYIPDPFPDQTPQAGFRVIRLINNRVHAGRGHLIKNLSSINAEYLQVQAIGNYIDTFAGLLNGSCINSKFSSNEIINADFVRCFDVDSMINTRITDTTFTGALGTDVWDTQIFFVCRDASSNVDNVTVSGSTISQLRKEVFRLDGAWKNFKIDDNLISDVTLDNDTATALPVVRLLSDGTGLTFTNNTCDIPNMTNKAPVVSLSGRAGSQNTEWTMFGNKIPSYLVETDFDPFYMSNENGEFGVYIGDGSANQGIQINTTGKAVIVSIRSGGSGSNIGQSFMALSGTGFAGPGVLWDGSALTVSGIYNETGVSVNYCVIK